MKIEEDKAVKLDAAAMDVILQTHLIDPMRLRADDFEGFMKGRKSALLACVESAMGKASQANDTEPMAEDPESDEEE